MNNLLRLSKVDKTPNFPLRACTLYKWRVLGKYPRLFAKIGGACFVNLDELNRIIEQGG
jgi:hypothetical protein